mgnify:CR=1 FL=1
MPWPFCATPLRLARAHESAGMNGLQRLVLWALAKLEHYRYIKFAIETLIDEVGRGVGADPLAYRMDLLSKNPRGAAVLKAVADMSQWGKAKLPKGHALGLAFSDAWNTYCGMVVQVSIDKGRPKVHKVWSAVDCGHALQPQNVQAQSIALTHTQRRGLHAIACIAQLRGLPIQQINDE